jgi:SAM-dependent methyltransferase
MNVNRDKWDESVPLHVASPLYDVPAFLRGRTTLHPLEVEEMGPVRGRTLLHLQCHFGLDTLSWARRGATVTGVDFSLPAIRAARALARRSGTPARFVRSNVYDLPGTLGGSFDLVYTGKGATCWLPDIGRWARVVAAFLAPGGRLFLFEDHPVIEVFPNGSQVTSLEAKVPYFTRGSIREEFDGTYATDVKMKHRVSYSWIHPVGEVLTALATAGLVIESVREYPFSYWHRYAFMTEDRHGYWHLTRGEGLLPLAWSVTARRPAEVTPARRAGIGSPGSGRRRRGRTRRPPTSGTARRTPASRSTARRAG